VRESLSTLARGLPEIQSTTKRVKPMPRAHQFINATRTIKVALTFEENSERIKEEFAVMYRAFSPRVAAEMAAVEQNEGANIARSLARILVMIPDIVDDDKKPIAMTEENLEQFTSENLKALYEGVLCDINPTAPTTILSDSPPASETASAAAS